METATSRQSLRNKLTTNTILIALILLGILNAQAEIKIVKTNTASTNSVNSKIAVSLTRMAVLEADLRSKTGLNSLTFGESGTLSYDRNEVSVGGSRKMREVILGAIDDRMNVIEIVSALEGNKVQFAVTDIGTKDIGSGITTYRVMYDFGDFENCRKYTENNVLDSFSTGIALVHEIDHKVSYDPNNPIPKTGVRPDKSKRGVRGVIDNVNTVRKELSLVLRRPNQHKGHIYKGRINTYKKTYQIAFINKRSKRKSFLRWKLENDRG